MKRFVLILATVLVQLAVGEDLYWVKNSNWNTPSNWALGRPPCSGEIASFASVRQKLNKFNVNIHTKVRHCPFFITNIQFESVKCKI